MSKDTKIKVLSKFSNKISNKSYLKEVGKALNNLPDGRTQDFYIKIITDNFIQSPIRFKRLKTNSWYDRVTKTHYNWKDLRPEYLKTYRNYHIKKIMRQDGISWNDAQKKYKEDTDNLRTGQIFIKYGS